MVGSEITKLFTDTCAVYVTTTSPAALTNIETESESVLFSGEPCRISFQTLSASAGDETAKNDQSAKLFISSAKTVPEGSRIDVTRGTRTLSYKASGSPAVYDFHQEIMLVPYKERA